MWKNSMIGPKNAVKNKISLKDSEKEVSNMEIFSGSLFTPFFIKFFNGPAIYGKQSYIKNV